MGQLRHDPRVVLFGSIRCAAHRPRPRPNGDSAKLTFSSGPALGRCESSGPWTTMQPGRVTTALACAIHQRRTFASMARYLSGCFPPTPRPAAGLPIRSTGCSFGHDNARTRGRPYMRASGRYPIGSMPTSSSTCTTLPTPATTGPFRSQDRVGEPTAQRFGSAGVGIAVRIRCDVLAKLHQARASKDASRTTCTSSLITSADRRHPADITLLAAIARSGAVRALVWTGDRRRGAATRQLAGGGRTAHHPRAAASISFVCWARNVGLRRAARELAAVAQPAAGGTDRLAF